MTIILETTLSPFHVKFAKAHGWRYFYTLSSGSSPSFGKDLNSIQPTVSSSMSTRHLPQLQVNGHHLENQTRIWRLQLCYGLWEARKNAKSTGLLWSTTQTFFNFFSDQTVRNLTDCFGSEGKLSLYYSKTQAWGWRKYFTECFFQHLNVIFFVTQF